ncbi:chlorophyll a/b-binding protein [Calothrix sp. 336/3]|uniref:chlorophyll a/b-binding protein n=1 Tax=Calothrix sp. 336/3 TaxID=1337936 RepID=UPI0004E2CCBC|nr:high light inducible protein [Calothrix sp. 336/3]
MSAKINMNSSMKNKQNIGLWGFTPQAELWNGRLAMIGFMSAILIEAFSGQGLLHFWSIL